MEFDSVRTQRRNSENAQKRTKRHKKKEKHHKQRIYNLQTHAYLAEHDFANAPEEVQDLQQMLRSEYRRAEGGGLADQRGDQSLQRLQHRLRHLCIRNRLKNVRKIWFKSSKNLTIPYSM